MNNSIFELADKLKKLKNEKDALSKELKCINAEIEETDLALSEAMTEEECERFSRNGSTFYLTSRTFASPQAGKKQDMISALKNNGYGDIVTETVNANTLASFVKEQELLADGEDLPTWLTDVVNVYEKISVGIRKS